MSNYKPYQSILSKPYWISSAKKLKSTQMLVLAAIFVALRVAISTLFIPLPSIGTQRIYFSYIVIALGSYIYGPLVGILVGFVGDILGCLIFPSGAYFFGYTLTAMVGGLIYGLFLYRRDITVTRLFACKFTINIFVNVLMNSLWDSILIGKAYKVLIVARLPKNLIMLPFEVLLMYICFKTVLPILEKNNTFSKWLKD